MYDGDLCLLIDNETMMRGVDTKIPVVIDIDDKATTIEEEKRMSIGVFRKGIGGMDDWPYEQVVESIEPIM